MMPTLPEAEIRAAVAAGDWSRAMALLTEHERELLIALPQASGKIDSVAPWMALLRAQRTLLAELERARAAAGAALQRMRSEQRGVHAYRQGSLQ
jgi:hypothetical protein